MFGPIKMSGVYMLNHPFYSNTFKLGCSANISQRLMSGDYCRMFKPSDRPKLIAWISVDGYETLSEVLYLEQSIFRQLAHKRCEPNMELFENVTIEEVAFCIYNLQLVPKIHYEAPMDNGFRIKKRYNFDKISVKPFQVPILAKMKTYFESNNRGKLILPCGYGKMYLALFLIRDKFDTAIIACPSLLLCQQFTEVAQKICTEHSVGMQEGKKWIIITTYQSLSKCAEYNPKLFILDEAHHTCVTSKSAEEESLFRSMLKFTANKHLFMTATEKVLKDDDNDDELWYSMDNKEFYGNEIIKKDFSEAIAENIICDYRLAVVNSGNPIQIVAASQQILGTKWLLTYHNNCKSCKEFQDQLNSSGIAAFYIDGDMSMDQRMLILKAFEQRPYSVLCSVNVLSEGISLPFVDSAYFVDPRGSEIDIIQRVGRCLRMYKDKSLATIILSDNILEYAALLRSLVVYDPKSKISIKRKLVGLGFSLNMNKFTNIVNDLSICIMGRCDAQWQVKWESAIDYEKENKQMITYSTHQKGINIGIWISVQKAAIKGQGNYTMNDERMSKLLQLITIQKWLETKDTKIKSSWDEKISLCHEYESKYGIIKTNTQVYNGIHLTNWIQKHQQAIKGVSNCKIDDYKREKLFELLTIQEWYKNNVEDGKWLDIHQLCVEYEKSSGSIKKKSKVDGVVIGDWLCKQKAFIKSGKTEGVINEKRLSKLFELNTIKEWYLDSYLDGKWMKICQSCIEYENANNSITQKSEKDGVKIGNWINSQKAGAKGKAGVMNKNRLNQLLKISAFYEWYLLNQNECLPNFQGFHLRNVIDSSSFQLETIV
jgi:superfamily II DNA or RNA helicase